MADVQKRDGFATKFGVIAAAAGSAIGLGNIWKFPYITGENGGAAFILVYLGCIALIGVPVMLSEFVIGRRGQKDAAGSFRRLAPGTPWFLTGWMGIAAAFMILAFYGVVAGWTLHYTFMAIGGNFESMDPAAVGNYFGSFISTDFLPIFWQGIFMTLTAGIVLAGVKNGIEKYSKILMPLLLGLLVILAIRSMTLPGAGAGIDFLLKPDFSKLTGKAVLDALGHAFFSLSLGMGTMITYGSYINKKENLGTTAIQVTLADTGIALLAGLAIFPAVFAFNVTPSAGPGLVFVTLPSVFNQMFGGPIFATMFFALLAVAALTSSISILEVVVAYFSEEKGMDRKKATIIVTILITVIGMLASLSMGRTSDIMFPFFSSGEWIRVGFFDLLDKFSANFLLPIGGLFISLFVGWKMKAADVRDEVSNGGTLRAMFFWVFIWAARIIAPVGIIIVFLYNLGIIQP
ncbi:MAG: sodium-dependent transporter [Spirochaetes bacterium]|nr:sodium-dependent transporter [Spirochaetota bacterium]MBU0955829.1 sodium-dependent transporter [Spirochaetota bacterium]